MKLHWLLPRQSGIPVLMYHRVCPDLQDRITHSPTQLEEQLSYLKQEGYQAIALDEYLEIAKGQKPLVGKKVLLTFDDGYLNNLTYAYPLLQRLGFKATFFIIGDTLEGNLNEAEPISKRMSVAQLKSLDPETIQLAMHGFHHENFSTIPLSVIQAALTRTIEVFQAQGMKFHKSIAYPYGAMPEDKNVFAQLKSWMKDNGIEAAFRIGNKVSEIPAQDLYELKRIDMRGTDSFSDFKIKLRKGKLHPF